MLVFAFCLFRLDFDDMQRGGGLSGCLGVNEILMGFDEI